MPRNGYLLYDASVEQIPPGEDQTIRAIVESIARTSDASLVKHHHGIRQQHAKGQGFLKGELTVYDNLPDHLRQGMFAAARTYRTFRRV